MEAFVLNPNEIVRKEFRIRLDKSSEGIVQESADRVEFQKTIDLKGEIPDSGPPGPNYLATMCLVKKATSPTEREIKGYVEGYSIFRWKGGKGGSSLFVSEGPWVIWRKTVSPGFGVSH
jgi:hypothetical protein